MAKNLITNPAIRQALVATGAIQPATGNPSPVRSKTKTTSSLNAILARRAELNKGAKS